MTHHGGAEQPTPNPLLAALTGLTSLSILAQAVLAGGFVDQRHHHGWVSAHQVNGFVALVLAILTAVVAVVEYRGRATAVVIGSVVLALLLAVEVGVGMAVSNSHHERLLLIHIPLAMLLFGLTVWLSVLSSSRMLGARR